MCVALLFWCLNDMYTCIYLHYTKVHYYIVRTHVHEPRPLWFTLCKKSRVVCQTSYSQLMRANKLKTALSRNYWLVWPHHDSVFSCTCIYMTCIYISVMSCYANTSHIIVPAYLVSLQLVMIAYEHLKSMHKQPLFQFLSQNQQFL